MPATCALTRQEFSSYSGHRRSLFGRSVAPSAGLSGCGGQSVLIRSRRKYGAFKAERGGGGAGKGGGRSLAGRHAQPTEMVIYAAGVTPLCGGRLGTSSSLCRRFSYHGRGLLYLPY